MAAATPPVFFDARTIRPGMSGVGLCAVELARALAARGVRVRATVLTSSLESLDLAEQVPGVEWLPIDIDYQSHPAGDIGLRTRVARMVEPDEVYHGPAFILPGGRQNFARVVTIHDTSVFRRPKDQSLAFGAYMRWSIRRAAAAADLIIMPTEAMKNDLIRLIPGVEPKIRLVPDAPISFEPRSRTTDEVESIAPPAGPYFISLGALEPRKDPLTATRALGELTGDSEGRAQWIWLGGEGHRGAELSSAIAALPDGKRFKRLDRVDRPTADRLIKHATALVYPSLFEGFGLPPLEAMVAGTPAIVADLPVLREVCGDAALYFAPGDHHALAGVLRRVLTDPELRDRMIKMGLARGAGFSWARAAEQTAEIYAEAAAGSP